MKTIDFITELMTSGTLKDFLKRAKAIKLKGIRRWSFNVLQAIQYLHSMDPPIMHRDLKCENIFINGSYFVIFVWHNQSNTVVRLSQVMSAKSRSATWVCPDSKFVIRPIL